MKRYIAEFIGTFALVFCGTGAIIVNQQTNGAVGLVGISASFGFIIIAIIYALGPISSAHINPAVTISLWIGNYMQFKEAIIYILAQIVGAIVASVCLFFIFPNSSTLGMTLPIGEMQQSFILEVMTTFLLMLVILGTSQQESQELKTFSGMVIGFTVMGLIFVAGPISGGSFNPARSIGPAVVEGNFRYLWLYIVAPVLGSSGAVLVWKFLKK